MAAAKLSTQMQFPALMTAADAPSVREGDIGTLGSWKDENPTLMSAIESEKSMILVIAFLIVIAGTSSIFAAQWLLVSDKIREIGILRALGVGVEGVMSVFVLNGLLMGIIGSACGALVGLLVVRKIDAVAAFISWIMGREVFPQDIYLFATIPTKVDKAAVVQYSLAALACTLVASAIPALRAGLMDPAKALHRE
jgi:lipoprotein-releasing system permease protein